MHVLNIDFYGRLKGLVLLSTKMSKNNRPFKVLHSARCLHNKLFQIQFGFSSYDQLALRIELWVCSHGVMMPRALEDVLRWRNSHGAFVQNLSLSPFSSSYSLLFSTSLFLSLSPSFSLSLSLTHIEMKGLLWDDGALPGSHPGPTSA